jgi:hypothetical protein
MDIRIQAKFCQAHKEKSARREWVTKGYPNIDWSAFDGRIADVALNPGYYGYYGTRGLRAMSNNILSKFSPELREIAFKDRLVAARGVAAYVETVLVPELVVRFISEDMKVSEEKARQIMMDTRRVIKRGD